MLHVLICDQINTLEKTVIDMVKETVDESKVSKNCLTHLSTEPGKGHASFYFFNLFRRLNMLFERLNILFTQLIILFERHN